MGSKRVKRAVLLLLGAGLPVVQSGSPLVAGATINVTTTSDTMANEGLCSLREAITSANTDTSSGGAAGECAAGSGTDLITFGISGTGPFTISPTSALPTISSPVTIDGYSQPGASPASSSPATLMIELKGDLAGGNGLAISAGGSTVEGLAINKFPGDGIRLQSNGEDTIEGNYIGTDAQTGTMGLIGNRGSGIEVTSDSPNNTIGGQTAAARNLISGNGDGNTGNGLLIRSSGNVVQGNFIGTDATGGVALGNTDSGAFVLNATNNEFRDNVVSANGEHGLRLQGISPGGNEVYGNLIGTDVTGANDLGNALDGIVIGIGNATVGGTVAGAANVIANNGQNGVTVASGGFQPTATIRGNSIHSNDDLGIDLGDDGTVTANDTDDPDTGPNALQNFPVLASAVAGASTHVQGTLNTTPSTSDPTDDYTLDFYSSDTCDGSGYGEGATYLGSTVVETDADGDAAFDTTLNPTVDPGDIVTATATDVDGNTSEFSECETVQATPGGGGGGGGGGAPADSDNDGIPDSSDACPNEAEDVDGFEDSDGCPEEGPTPPAPQQTLPECQANPALHCGTNGNDNITIDGNGQTWFLGAGDDTVVVTGCDNTIYLQDGKDVVLLLNDCGNLIFLGTGNDEANVGQALARSSVDASVAGLVIRGEAGNDTIRGGTRDDSLLGGLGMDFVAGRAGSDVLRGGGGPDKLRGGAGNDVLKGGGARDSCKGGPGTNRLSSCES